MQLIIGDRAISKYQSVSVSLKYDAMASPFSISVYFDPSNSDDRKTFTPGKFNIAEVKEGNETLIKGAIINHGFRAGQTKSLISVGGYSKSGVLNECQTEPDGNTQFTGLSLRQMAEKLIAPFGLSLTVDSIAASDADSKAQNISPVIEVDMTIKEFLTTQALSKNIVISHTPDGNLLFTRADTTKQPIYDFSNIYPATSMDLTFNGAAMHNNIWAVGQAVEGSDNGTQDRSPLRNPYVQAQLDYLGIARNNLMGLDVVAYSTGYRPGVYKQKTGTLSNTSLTARQYLSQELRNIRLTIRINGWTLNGKIVRPNNIVLVQNPELYLYKTSKWFIEQVDLHGDERSQTATLHCVLPECFTTGDVENIFTGTNLTVPVVEPGAHATITPFI